MRKIVVAFLAFSFTLTVHAQTTFGLKMGANIANLKISTGGLNVVLDSKTGFHGGGFFTIPAAKNFTIQPEFVYSMEGAQFKQTSSKINLHCINLPILFQYNSGGFIVEAGPQLGFLLSAQEDGQDVTNGYENINIALGFGAAYRLKEGVGISARYNLGLTSVAKDQSQEVAMKSNVLQLGVTFHLATITRR
jgi:hypothetical protein